MENSYFLTVSLGLISGLDFVITSIRAKRSVFLRLHTFVFCCKFHLLGSSSPCLHLLFSVVKRSVMKVSDRFVPEHSAFTLPIQTFWSSFCGGTLHYVGTQLLSRELERTIRLLSLDPYRLHWVTKGQQPGPVLELLRVGRLNPLSSLE